MQLLAKNRNVLLHDYSQTDTDINSTILMLAPILNVADSLLCTTIHAVPAYIAISLQDLPSTEYWYYDNTFS